MRPGYFLLVWPLVEIALFVTVGGRLGLWSTLAIVLGTAVGGILLMRWRGLRAIRDLRAQVQQMGNPLPMAADQAMFMLAAILLVLPGFLTDVLGLILLLPPVRFLLIAQLARRMPTMARTGPTAARDVIEGEFTEIDTPPPPQRGRSGWTQD
jgi:UPF0716 protein FxsA